MSSTQHDAHCHIMFETWPKPPKGKRKVMVPVYRKIQKITGFGGRKAVMLHTNAFAKTCFWLDELNAGVKRCFLG